MHTTRETREILLGLSTSAPLPKIRDAEDSCPHLPIFVPMAANHGNCARLENSTIMANPQPNNPLHGVKLEMILQHLVERHGWETLGRAITIRCFQHEPSIKSSLAFLRKTPWARQKVEQLYLESLAEQ